MTEPFAALARGALEILGRDLTEREAAQFSKYLELLTKWQKTVRLVGRSSPRWIVENLFLDSLMFLRALPTRFESLLDLGTGAGFPGIPIKIVKADVTLMLVEARQRRASFLSTVVRELGLERAEVVNARAEDALAQHAGRFDTVVMRCAGDAEALLQIARRFVRSGGRVVVSGPPAGHSRGEAGPEWIETPGLSVVRSGAPRRFRVETVV